MGNKLRMAAASAMLLLGTLQLQSCHYVHSEGMHRVAEGDNDSLPEVARSKRVDSMALAAIREEIGLEAKAEKLDTFFQKLHQVNRFNGTVLVAQRGQIIYHEAFGYSHVGKKTPMRKDSIFQLASVSKQFTAAAAMLLHQRGQLDYDALVQQYIPEFPYKGITIRHLLTHQSGLPDYIYAAEARLKGKARTFQSGNEQALQMFMRMKPKPYYSPGRVFDYSNTGYFVLATVVERVSGKPFGQFLEQEFFKPLGMDNTFAWNSDRLQQKQEQMTTGYSGRGIPYSTYFLDGVLGDKSVFSTAEDMFKWDQALYDGTIISPQVQRQAFERGCRSRTGANNYGFGYRLFDVSDGTRVVYHGGWWKGYATLFVHYEPNETNIVILSNKVNRSFSNIEYLLDVLDIPEFRR